MNWKPHALALLVFCLPRLAPAANFTVSFDTTSVPSPDSSYNDGESAVFAGNGTKSGFSTALSGVNYGDDVTSNQRWGLLDNSLPWNHAVPGGLIRHGFEPTSIGSTTAKVGTDTTAASYLLLRITPGEELLFSGLAVELQQTNTLCVDPRAWASTSADNFSSIFPITGGQSGHGGRAVWSFDGLDYAGSDPLEIRIYGVVGADEGALPLLRVDGNVVPVPEPACLSLLGALALLVRRRRSCSQA